MAVAPDWYLLLVRGREARGLLPRHSGSSLAAWAIYELPSRHWLH